MTEGDTPERKIRLSRHRFSPIVWTREFRAVAMKYRCPFCREVFEEFARPACPKCGKALRKSGGNGTSYKRTRRASTEMPDRRPLLMLIADRPRVMLWSLGLVAMAFIWIIMGNVKIGIPNTSITKADVTRNELRTMRTALEWFRTNCKRYPTTEEGLAALVIDPGVPGWQGHYIQALPPDLWGQPFQYASSNDTIRLFSTGADGLPGTADDVQAPDPDYKALMQRLAAGTGKTRPSAP